MITLLLFDEWFEKRAQNFEIFDVGLPYMPGALIPYGLYTYINTLCRSLCAYLSRSYMNCNSKTSYADNFIW